jgi:putative ABC transport system permease protein
MNITSLLDRVIAVLRRKHIEDELDEEIREHIEMATEENLRRGISLDEARYAARRSFGGIEQMKENHREGRGLPALERLVSDLRVALRGLSRKPAFTITSMATLAIGIGACTVVFSVVNAVLLTSLPYSHPEQLVFVSGIRGNEGAAISPPDFLDYRAHNRGFVQLASMGSSQDSKTLTGSAEPIRVHVATVSGNFFDVFQVRPVLGRSLTIDDEKDTTQVAVISHALWQSRYGARENIIGDTLHLDGAAFAIVGVTPRGFQFPSPADVWIPFIFSRPWFQDRGAHQLLAVGRLREDVALNNAREDMSIIAARLMQQYPDTNKGFTLRLSPLHQELVAPLKSPLFILVCAVGLLLLLACANVANLILARGTTRRRELATRIALGAGHGRLIRLLMSETLIIVFGGGALGVVLTLLVIPLLAALPVELTPGGQPIPGLADVSVDLRVLAFTSTISVLTALLVGLFPAFQNAGLSAMESLRSGSTRIGRHHRQTASKILVTFEIAISLTLLAGAGLVFRSFLNVLHIDPGFRPEHVLTLPINAAGATELDRKKYFDALLEQASRIPGVQNAAIVSELPLSGYGQEWYFDIESHPAPTPTERPVASYRRVSADYFRTLMIPLRRGRLFTPIEVERKAPVAIIDDRLAEMHFGGEDPIGKRIVYGTSPYEVVGVVGNVLHYALFQELIPDVGGAYPTVYVPDIETGGSMPTLILRSAGSNAGPLRDSLRRFDKNIPLTDIKPYDDILSASLLLPRFGTLLLAVFSGIGLALAVIGLYGVLSFATARRTSEIGLRMALGSSKFEVLKLIVSDGMKLSIQGVILGLAGAYGLARLLNGVLVRVSPGDPATFISISFLLCAAAFCASYIPARRAANTDPARVLRHD